MKMRPLGEMFVIGAAGCISCAAEIIQMKSNVCVFTALPKNQAAT
jgi:hypothetical protein